MEPVRLEIAPEVNLDYVRSDKFKTGTLSVQLITPINEKTASFGALLPSVLRRGTMSHPDMRSLSTALDLLYGSSIGCTVRKKGENQCIGFAASFIDEEFVPGADVRPFGRAAARPRDAQRPLPERLCRKREAEPHRRHPRHHQRQARLRRPALTSGDVPRRALRGGQVRLPRAR